MDEQACPTIIDHLRTTMGSEMIIGIEAIQVPSMLGYIQTRNIHLKHDEHMMLM